MMNERIQELIEQSNGHWNLDLTIDHHGDFITSHSVKFQEDDIEKFAELIVRECIDIVPWMYEAKIKQHFGVEE